MYPGYMECNRRGEDYTLACGYTEEWLLYPIYTGIMYYDPQQTAKDGKYFSITKEGTVFVKTTYNDKNSTKVIKRIGIQYGNGANQLFECKIPSDYEFVMSIYDDGKCDQTNVVTYYSTTKPNSCTQTRSGGEWFLYQVLGDAVSIYKYSTPYCSEESLIRFDDYVLDTCQLEMSISTIQCTNMLYH